MTDYEEQRAQLAVRERVYRQELRNAAGALRAPVERVSHWGEMIRRAKPLLPLAGVIVTALMLTAQFRRGRLRPLTMLTMAIDAWRLWKIIDGDPRHHAPGRALTHRS